MSIIQELAEAIGDLARLEAQREKEAEYERQLALDIEAEATAPKPKAPKARKAKASKKPEFVDGRVFDHSAIIRDVDAAITALRGCKEIGLDIETGGLNPLADPIAVYSLKGDNGVVAILHTRGRTPANLKAFLSEPGRLYVVHNGTVFDVPFLEHNGIHLPRWFDTLTVESLAQTSGRKDVSRSLKATVARRLGKDVPKGIHEHSWMKPELSDEEIQYCIDDVEFLIPLMHSLIKKIEETGQRDALKLELAIAPVVTGMTLTGLPVNRERLVEYLDKQRELSETNKARLLGYWGEINLDSPAQLKKAYKMMGVDMRDGKGKETTNIERLTAIRTHHPEAEVREVTGWLVDYKYGRQRIKMYGEWAVEGNPVYYNGRVRAKFWQTGTGTLRFSSSEPNLQQVPRDMREVFGHLEGYTIVSIDYAGIEMVVAAALAADEDLVRALHAEDIHKAVASMLFQKDIGDISKDERQQAKAAGFCLIFGGGAGTLQVYARMYGQELTLEQCREIVTRFFNRFKGLKRKRSNAYRFADERPGGPLKVRLPNGAYRVLVGYDAKATSLLNTEVQGTAAGGLKAALKRAKIAGVARYLGAVVHDETVAVVPDAVVPHYIETMSECMISGMYDVMPRWITTPSGERLEVPVRVGVVAKPYWSKD